MGIVLLAGSHLSWSVIQSLRLEEVLEVRFTMPLYSPRLNMIVSSCKKLHLLFDDVNLFM